MQASSETLAERQDHSENAILLARQDIATQSGWNSGQHGVSPQLSGTLSVDFLIIGGGFAGLSSAYHLQHRYPDRSIVVIDADHIGSGASGRSGGILSAGVGTLYSIGLLRALYGERRAVGIYRATVQAVESVQNMIRREGLDVELERTGHFKAAASPGHAEALRRQAQTFAELGIIGPRYLDQKGFQSYLGRENPCYYGGLHFVESAQLNPAKLATQWKRLLSARGVQFFEETPALHIEAGKPLKVVTPEGAIRANQVIVATNGYAPQHGIQHGRIFPMHTFALVTRSLTVAEHQRARWGNLEPIIDSRNYFNYYRFTAQGNLFFGGGRVTYHSHRQNAYSGRADVIEQAQLDSLEREFRGAFPELQPVEIVHRWGGPMGFTCDTMPTIGPSKILPGAWFIGGWSGHGVALSSASGEVLASLISGESSRSEVVPWVRQQGMFIPPDPLRKWVLSLILRGLDALDRRALRWMQPQAG